MNLSIKNRIAVISALSVAVISAAIFLLIYQSLKVAAYAEIDEKLEFEAVKHYHELIFEKDTIYFAYPGELLEREHVEIEIFPIFIELRDTKNRLLVKSQNLKTQSIINEQLKDEKAIFNNQLLSEPLRQIQTQLKKNDKIYGSLGIAVPLDDTKKILLNLKNNLFLIYPLLIAITFITSRFISTITIKPLTKITDTVSIISAKNLNLRLEQLNGNDELTVLTNSINSFLERIQNTIEKEQQFTTNASHQLRTPLTAIKGNLEVLIRRERTSENYEQGIKISIEHLNQLVNTLENLLLLTKIDENSKYLKRETFDLIELINNKIKLYKSVIQHKNLTVKLINNLADFKLFSNPYLVKIIIDNIISNAVKYSFTNHTINITIDQNDKHLLLSITNTGPKLSEEDKNNLFEIFYRAENNTEEGHGIGLALAKKAADALNFHIEVKADQQTTFTLFIPLVQNLRFA